LGQFECRQPKVGVYSKVANRFNIEVTESGTGKTRDEIARLLNEVKAQASDVSRTLNDLRSKSIAAREATNEHSKVLSGLRTRLAEGRTQLEEVNKQLAFHRREFRAAEKEVASYDKRINKNADTLAKLVLTGQSQSKQAKSLVAENQTLAKAIVGTTTTMDKHIGAITSLSKQQDYLANGQKTLVQALINEKQVHNDLVQSQNAVNVSKQKVQQTSSNLEAQVRKLNAENRELEKTLRKSEQEAKKLDAAAIALANVVGNILYNAFRDLISIGKQFITDATIYASRTDEMRLAMLNMSKQSGVSRGELLLQSDAMRRMNITTQETYSTLTKFQLAQLDVTKATQLARVAQDLAVVAGVETGEEVNRLVHGITTLQIRVLRTAGVFVSLEQSLKEAALAQGRSTESFSEAEKQQILLNKVLEVGARATGNYETSLDNAGKRMRSMTRIFQDMQNAIGGLLQGPFGNLVDILSLLMTVVAAAPKVFALFVAVLIAFGTHVARNMAVTDGWIKRIFALVASLREATAASLGLTKATQAQSDAVATATSRWGTFGRALVGVLATAGKLILITTALNTLMEAGAQIAKAAGGTTKFNTGELDKQTVSVNELVEAEQRLQFLREKQEQRKLSGYSDKYGRAQGFFGRFEEVLGTIPILSTFATTSSSLSKEMQDAQETVDKLNAKLEEQGDAVGVLSAIQREYAEQMGKAGKANLDFAATTGIIDLRLSRIKLQFEQLGNPIDEAGKVTLTFAEKLNVLKPEILGLDTVFQQIATSQEDYNRLIAEAEQKFPGFIDFVKTLRGEGEKYIEGVGEIAAETARRFVDIQRRLRASIREIQGLFGVGSDQELRAGNLELLEKRLQILRQEIDTINELRVNLNRDVGQPVPQDREARLSLQNVYETAIKVRDEIRAAQRANKDFIAEVVKAQQLASDARTTAVKTELIAAKLIAENQIKRVQDERQMTAEIVALTKQRADAAKDEAGTQRTAYAQFYKEQLENLIQSEDATRRLRAELSFISGQQIPGITVPQYGLGDISTKLENIILPAATQAENVATITQSVQNIEKAVTSGTSNVMGLQGLSSQTVSLINPGGKGFPLLAGNVVDAAKKYGIDPNLLVNLAYRESGIRQYGETGQVITSNKGAMGVMQLMPGTAARYGADPRNTAQNIDAGARYLADLLKMFNGQAHLALAAYNAGEFVAKAPGGGTIAQREARLRSLIEKNSDVNAYVRGVMGSIPSAGPFEPATSPRLSVGAEGTAFKRTGSETIDNLTPGQIMSALRQNAVVQRRLNRQIQEAYVGSPQARLDSYVTEVQTGKTELDQYKKNQSEIKLINERTARDFYDSEEHKKQVFTETELVRKRQLINTHNVILQLNEDERTGYRESAEYEILINEQAQIRIREAYNNSRDTLAAAQADSRARTQFHTEYLKTIHNNAETIRIRASQEAEDRYNLMIEETNSHWRESMEFRLLQYRNFEVSRYEEAKRVEDDIADLHNRIAFAKELDPLNIEKARLEAILEVEQADGEAKASMAANAVRLADAEIYHADRANSQILEYFAQQRSMDQIVADAKISTVEKIFGAIDNGLSRITSKMGFFGDIVKDIISGFARIALSKVFLTMFGITPNVSTGANQQGSVSNILGGLLGGFGSIFNQSTGGVGGTPPFVPNFAGGIGGGVFNPNVLFGGGAGASSQQASQGFLSNIFGKIANPFSIFTGGGGTNGVPIATPANRVTGGTWADFGRQFLSPSQFIGTGTKGLFSGLASGLAPLLPFLGGGLGVQLGGQSRIGSILGGIGGGVLGLGGAALLGSSSAAGALSSISTLGGLLSFALPVIPIAGALLVGAYFLNRNSKRRQNETKRDAFTTDALSKLNALLSQVRRDKIGGDEALAQAAQIRAEYMSASQSLNDSKTRNIAIKDVSRLDGIISQIKAAAKAQERRRELDLQLVPEFAGGARIVPGPIGAGDIIPALLSPGEMVLNVAQQRAVGYHNLARANIPSYVANNKYAGGGYATSPSYSRFNSSSQPMNIFVVADKKFAEDMAVEGRDKIVEIGSSDIRNRGKLYASIRAT
jgi:soluble lytic murein transglycosylase-like protein